MKILHSVTKCGMTNTTLLCHYCYTTNYLSYLTEILLINIKGLWYAHLIPPKLFKPIWATFAKPSPSYFPAGCDICQSIPLPQALWEYLFPFPHWKFSNELGGSAELTYDYYDSQRGLRP